MSFTRPYASPALLLKVGCAVLVSASLAASAKLPPNEVKITTDDQYRHIQANGIPDHAPGQFPNAHNPNVIGPQKYDYKVPLHP